MNPHGRLALPQDQLARRFHGIDFNGDETITWEERFAEQRHRPQMAMFSTGNVPVYAVLRIRFFYNLGLVA